MTYERNIFPAIVVKVAPEPARAVVLVQAAVLAVLVALAVLAAVPVAPAHAADIEQLTVNYQAAVQAYEDAVVEREQNADEIAELDAQIDEAESSIEQTREQLGRTAVVLYKELRGHSSLMELLFTSSSFTEAVTRLDQYARIQARYAERSRELVSDKYHFEAQRAELERLKRQIDARVTEAKQAADDAELALEQARHLDGDEYHQVQGNGENCGATSFTVGLNILLNEERYPDNVAVWEGPGFQGDSTSNLAGRALAWLAANGLDDEIGIEELRGDIRTTDELRERLERGDVVIISSGPWSVWQRADGTETDSKAFPNGHWIVFYRYDDEREEFLANDSSVSAAQGAGVAYDEDQMQQWLDGRGNHFATVMYTK